MTADERALQIEGMLTALSQCAPRDEQELTMWVDGDTAGQSQSAATAPIFQEEECYRP